MRNSLTRCRVVLVAGVLLGPLGTTSASAQTSEASVWDALGHTLSSPDRWDSDDWLLAGLTAGGATSALFIEEDLRDFLMETRFGAADALERVGRLYGSPIFTAPLALVTYGAGAAFDSDDLKDTGQMMTEVLLTALLVQQPLRIGVGRGRPDTGEGHFSFRPFTLDNEYASFVSGHSFSGFGVSNVMARQIERWWASVALYSLASVTALSRVHGDRHWLSDIILGSVLGYASSTTIWNYHNDRELEAHEAAARSSAWWLTISFPL